MTTATAETEIRALERAWADAEQAADADTLDGLATPTFRLVGPLGFVLTRDQWSQRYRAGGLRTASLDWRIESIAVYGDAAVTIGVHSQRATFNGAPVDGDFRSTHVAVRGEDGWQLASIQLSPIQAPRAAAGATGGDPR